MKMHFGPDPTCRVTTLLSGWLGIGGGCAGNLDRWVRPVVSGILLIACRQSAKGMYGPTSRFRLTDSVHV